MALASSTTRLKEPSLPFLNSGITKYKQILWNLSKTVHPFDINNLNRQTSISVELLLNQLVVEIKALQKEQGIKDPKKRIEKFAKQIKGISSIIDGWWLWAEANRKNKKSSLKGELLLCKRESST